jgi:uncharacterized protein (TIGR01777 family)
MSKPTRAADIQVPRTILVTGATGLLGRNLCRHLLERGDRLVVLARDARRARGLYGSQAQIVSGLDEVPASASIDAMVNLAGAPFMRLPWTQPRREELLASRIDVTHELVALIARLEIKPRVLISASSVGYYGVRGEEEVTEATRGQPIFQSHLCQAWELAAQAARNHGVRVCRLRLGLVLGNDGGVLPVLVQPARLGLRIVLGSGRQWVSWIHIEDAIGLVEFCIARDELTGGINACAPAPVRQRQLTAMLAARFGRAVTVVLPAEWLRSALGDMSQVLLEGQRVLPLQAVCSGFVFRYAHVGLALEQLLPAPHPERASAHVRTG